MKVILKRILNRCLKLFGITFLNEYKYKQLISSNVLLEKLNVELIEQLDQCRSKSIVGIVFSKDRAAQLHALLGSYYDQVKSPIQLFVLYFTSTQGHLDAYREVQDIFQDQVMDFVPQITKMSFREDLINIINNLDAKYLFFLVDDIVFVEPVDLKEIIDFAPNCFVPSLRMGLNLKYCYPLQKDQSLPSGIQAIPGRDELISWCWADGELDWNYPLSVDGHLFSFKEIKAMLNLLDYKAPNSLESALQQFNCLFINRKGIAYRKSRIVNIPINRVQLENKNIYGSIHQDELLHLWNKGMQIDYKKLYGVNNVSTHEELSINFIKRDNIN